MTRRWFTANSHAAVDRRCKGDKENHKGKNQLTRTQSCTNFSCLATIIIITMIPSIIIIVGCWVVVIVVVIIIVVISTFANFVREFRESNAITNKHGCNFNTASNGKSHETSSLWTNKSMWELMKKCNTKLKENVLMIESHLVVYNTGV